ncbi:MAG: hypothetical protein CO186_12640 [Zetaproteobacteria bacterium CG_4_9_14_3_um_filter_49_83]|nr:MAG: hypothetical protein CO186_12640 [Zetaproteobacteria bacterium CG_4_9_14_3_um_filter_49_83]
MLVVAVICVMPQVNNVKQASNSTSLFSAISYSAAWAGDEMERLQLSLKKLTSALASMKEFDKLEEQGLPKRQVQLMKEAMNNKIETMMSAVLQNIQNL